MFTFLYVRWMLFGFLLLFENYDRISESCINMWHYSSPTDAKIGEDCVPKFLGKTHGELELDNLIVTEVGIDLEKGFDKCGVILHFLVPKGKGKQDEWGKQRVFVCKIEEANTPAICTQGKGSAIGRDGFSFKIQNDIRRWEINSSSRIMKRRCAEISNEWNTNCVRLFIEVDMMDGENRNVKEN